MAVCCQKFYRYPTGPPICGCNHTAIQQGLTVLPRVGNDTQIELASVPDLELDS